jgi:hypothetical protein
MMRARTKHKPLIPTRTEAEVLRGVLQAATMLGITLERRNTGGATYGTPEHRQYVKYGEPGSSDLSGHLKDGRRLDVEVKREGFNPRKVHGPARERFRLQIARLKKLNEDGGVGLWVDSPEAFVRAMQRVMQGWRVEIDYDVGWPYVVTDGDLP